MSETTDFEKTQKSKQYLKISMSEMTDLKKIQKSKQYLKITISDIVIQVLFGFLCFFMSAV